MKPETITPKLAQELLSANTGNRSISRGLVSKYARDMKEGRWAYNGSAILVADTGKLLDGQHRLLACVSADKPFQSLIVRGLPESIMATVDAGRKRSASDMLGMGGVTNAAVLAAAIRTTVNYLNGDSFNTSVGTPSIFDFYERFPEIGQVATLCLRASKVVQPGSLTSVVFLGTRAPTYTKRGHGFVDALVDGAELRQDDPRLALRNLFINARLRTPGGRLPAQNWTFPAIVMGWNAYIRQEPTLRIKPQPNKQGRIVSGDILGGPAFGAGIDALTNVRAPNLRRANQAAEPELVRA